MRVHSTSSTQPLPTHQKITKLKVKPVSYGEIMIIGIGTDIVEIERIAKSIERNGDHFKKYIYRESEINYCSQKKGYESYAARFAAKEAFSKAMGTGIGGDLSFKDIEIKNDDRGKPSIIYHGNLLDKYSNYNIQLSLSHSKENAIAYVIVEVIE